MVIRKRDEKAKIARIETERGKRERIWIKRTRKRVKAQRRITSTRTKTNNGDKRIQKVNVKKIAKMSNNKT